MFLYDPLPPFTLYVHACNFNAGIADKTYVRLSWADILISLVFTTFKSTQHLINSSSTKLVENTPCFNWQMLVYH